MTKRAIFDISKRFIVNKQIESFRVMPGDRSGDSKEEEDVVFQSPEWDSDQDKPDQGASPHLRRSARKRKSTAGDSMTKGLAQEEEVLPTKSPAKSMPKVHRSPMSGQMAQTKSKGKNTTQPPLPTATQSQSFEALLLAMEGRLAAKMEKSNEATKEAISLARLNNEGLENLETRVDANENCMMQALGKSKARIIASVRQQVEGIVKEQVQEILNSQLHAAGFDQDLSAGDLSLRNSVRMMVSRSQKSTTKIPTVSW